jgi:C-terminal processing protease CtpA/Prc
VWLLDGKRLAAWNQIVRLEALGNPVTPEQRADQPRPRPGARLRLDRESGVLPAGPEPWRGEMAVLVDHTTASAGESTAWMLRQAFGAELVGTPTAGALTYGDLAPYLLPRSGLELMLPTIQFDVPSYELDGIPVDVECDPRVPLAEFARDQR